MIRTPTCILAAALTVLLLPMTARASGKDSKTPGDKSRETESTAAPPASTNVADPLLRLLMTKGILNMKEVNSLASGPADQLRERLVLMLKEKGILSDTDVNALKTATVIISNSTSSSNSEYASGPKTEQSSGPPQPPKTPPSSGPIPAIAPIRPFQIDPPKHEGFIPDIKIGKNVNIKPYGFIKASVVYDTSSPYGNDFPLPGFIGDINGPDAFPEFHVKARFIRFGSNFEWLDTPNVVVTGKVEADFEGNFGRSNNRNISTIRSNMFQFRLGYGRVDWKLTDTNSVFFLAGQDWTPFGSSTLPNLFETTAIGIGFGTLYERAPQLRVGYEHKLGGSRNFAISPEFAIVLPSFGNLPADIVAAGAVVPNNEGIGNKLGVGGR